MLDAATLTPTPTPRYLLLLGCSDRKHLLPELLPALDRYDGVNYRVLQRARRLGQWPSGLDILIVSAEYGLLASDVLIPTYDRRMTAPRARELMPAISADLDACLAAGGYAEVFVNLGKAYRGALAGSQRIQAHPHVIYAEGGIGEKMSQMKRWLYGRAAIAQEDSILIREDHSGQSGKQASA